MEDLKGSKDDVKGAPAPSKSALRIGTVERDRTVEALKEHAAAGRLELDEFDERVGHAFSARTAADLDRLVADLPRLRPVAVSPVSAEQPAGRPVRRRARHRIQWAMWSPYFLVNAMMLAIWGSSGGGYFWPIWVIGPWGAALLLAEKASHGGRSRSQPRRPHQHQGGRPRGAGRQAAAGDWW